MSSAIVSSPKKTQSRPVPAKWDEEKTRILLEVFEQEINNGNKPSGIYSKQAWLNIVLNFNAKAGLGYNKDQIKNRQDNLRREFTKWEALIGKEIGLGWNNEKRMLEASDDWLADKAKVESSILQYKDAGPIHLDLLQKVFGGVTANGFHAYIPSLDDQLFSGNSHLESIENMNDFNIEGIAQQLNFNIEVDELHEIVQETMPTSSNRASSSKVLRVQKRLRDDEGKRVNHSDELTTTVSSLNDTLRENMVVLHKRFDEHVVSYSDALDLLKGLPGFGYEDEIYWKGVRILEDKTRRIAFVKILDGGINAVCRWLSTFRDI